MCYCSKAFENERTVSMGRTLIGVRARLIGSWVKIVRWLMGKHFADETVIFIVRRKIVAVR